MPSDVPLPPGEDALPTEAGPRYHVDGPDEAADPILRRQVHARTASLAEADALEAEACYGARLEHGSIPAVYDFIRDSEGAVLVTRQVRGITLAEAVADARTGTIRAEIASAVSALQTMQRVVEALMAAHAHGIVHRQLTPSVITLAQYGEVLVGGWQYTASQKGTTLSRRYTATTTRLQVLDDLHGDLHAVGACMFEALVRRPPCRDGDPFAGIGETEGALLSPRICSLIRSAMRSANDSGFRSAEELHRAIVQCIAAEIADAVPPRRCLPARFWRLGLATAGVCLVIALAAAWLAVPGDQADETRLVDVTKETFADDSWRSRWSGTDDWTVRNGRLISTTEGSARLTYRHRLSVPVVIEYTGSMLDGHPAGDLSVIWSEDLTAGRGTRIFQIQAGAFDNSHCCIQLRPDNLRLAYSPMTLVPEREYRFRVEIEGDRFAMSIDGVPVLEHRERFPSTSGYVTLLGWYPGKAFDNVRLQGLAIRERQPASTAGDAFYSYGYYEEAAAIYNRLVEGSASDSRLAQDALFRKGMAERRSGKIETSSETWSLLNDPELRQVSDCLRLADLVATGQHELFLQRMRAYWRRNPLIHADLLQQWCSAADAVMADKAPMAFAEPLLHIRNELFPDDNITGHHAGRILLRLGRNEDVLLKHPNEIRLRVLALLALGRLNEIDRMPGLTIHDRMAVDQARGRFAAITEYMPRTHFRNAVALCKLGRASESPLPHPAWLYLGRADELLLRRPITPAVANECLVLLGRIEEAAGAGVPEVPGSGKDPTALALLGRVDEAEAVDRIPRPWLRLLQAVEADDPAIPTLRAAVSAPHSMNSPWFPGMVIGPFCDFLAGRPEPFDTAMRTMAGWRQSHGLRAWYFARAVLGESDEQAVLGMPAVVEAQAWWHLATALRAERAGCTDDARAAYDAFLSLPTHQRLLEENTLNAPIECLVRWRRRALAR